MRRSQKCFLCFFLSVFTVAYYSGLFHDSSPIRPRPIPANNSEVFEGYKACLWTRLLAPGPAHDGHVVLKRDGVANEVNRCVRNKTAISPRDFLIFHMGPGELAVHFLPPKPSPQPVVREYLDPRKATKPTKVGTNCIKLTIGVENGELEKEFALEFPECKIYGLEDHRGKESKDFWNYGALIPVGVGRHRSNYTKNIVVGGRVVETRTVQIYTFSDILKTFVLHKPEKSRTIHFVSLRTDNPEIIQLLIKFIARERGSRNPVGLCQIDVFLPAKLWSLKFINISLQKLFFRTGHVPIFAAESQAGQSFSLIDAENENCEEVFAFSKHFAMK